jgi:IS5 family transposase
LRGLGNAERLPDRVSILRFRHLLEEHELALQILATVNATLSAKGLMLKSGTAIDATLIAAPTSTKNSTGTRDPQMHQTKKRNQWYHGMKSHIGIDADSGLVHSVVGTAASVNDVTQAHRLVHGEETDVFAGRRLPRRGKARRNPRHRSQVACGHAPGQTQSAGQEQPDGGSAGQT